MNERERAAAMSALSKGKCTKMSGKKSLSRNQRKALDALLEHGTITKSAPVCGLSEKTLSRYLKDPLFRSELASKETVTQDETGRVFLRGQLTALSVLLDLMKNGESESTRRLAARDWLDMSLRWRETNLDQRLSNLERDYYGKSKE